MVLLFLGTMSPLSGKVQSSFIKLYTTDLGSGRIYNEENIATGALDIKQLIIISWYHKYKKVHFLSYITHYDGKTIDP